MYAVNFLEKSELSLIRAQYCSILKVFFSSKVAEIFNDKESRPSHFLFLLMIKFKDDCRPYFYKRKHTDKLSIENRSEKRVEYHVCTS